VHPLTAHTSHPALEDGTDTGFRNVDLPKFDAGCCAKCDRVNNAKLLTIYFIDNSAKV
jgi:hypothetical protein